MVQGYGLLSAAVAHPEERFYGRPLAAEALADPSGWATAALSPKSHLL
ncbi:MAG TPA: hypothetical protein VK674_05700 [Candidatus Limnocylindria bacterium]|nr:hypothetical protein [Candidatus Limnocylindria bacterium]